MYIPYVECAAIVVNEKTLNLRTGNIANAKSVTDEKPRR